MIKKLNILETVTVSVCPGKAGVHIGSVKGIHKFLPRKPAIQFRDVSLILPPEPTPKASRQLDLFVK